MEQKDIQFNKGIHRAPSMAAQEGELSECVNLIPKNGELVNIKPPTQIGITLNSGEILLAIHKTAEYTHYVTKYSNVIGYRDSVLKTFINTGLSSVDVKQIVAVGNCLSVIYDHEKNKPMDYLLWKKDTAGTKKYVKLSRKPKPDVQFSLSGTFRQFTEVSQQINVSTKTGRATGENYNTKLKTYSYSDLYVDGVPTLAKSQFPDTMELGKTYAIEILSQDYAYISINDYLSGIYYSRSAPKKFVFLYDASVINIRFKCPSSFQFSINAKDETSTEDNSAESDAPWKITTDTDGSNFKAVQATMNKFINYWYYQNKNFIFPFFVRCAFRLYDGSYVNLTEPILLMPNNELSPIPFIPDISSENKATLSVAAYGCNLNIKFSGINDFKDWKDIIVGLSIGISSPIYYYNQGEEYDSMQEQITIWNATETNMQSYYGIFNDTQNFMYDSSSILKGSSATLYYAMPPHYSSEGYKTNFLSSNIIYRIKDYTWEEIEAMEGNITRLDMSNVNLKILETYPVIEDNSIGLNDLYPEGGFAYNNRLNVYNVKEQLKGIHTPISPIITTTSDECYKIAVYIRNLDQEYITVSEWNYTKYFFKWFYYPNSNAYKMVVFKNSGGTIYEHTANLTPHPWMNGAYAYDNGEVSWTVSQLGNIPNTSKIDVTTHENAIYASNVNNPFFFPVSCQSNIGTGKIETISTSAKALSQGQFGQFPLYAFTADGIWALSVNDDGRYATSNPVNRDIVTNKESVCQIDDSVVYACSQGLKQLAGSETKTLTTAMEGLNVNEDIFLSNLEYFSGANSIPSDTMSMTNMLHNCKIMYDSAESRRLHIYPANAVTTGKHYMYDMESEEWSTVLDSTSKVKAVVPGYPYSTIQVDNKLMQYDNTESNNILRKGVILTREMSFGNPFTNKMLCDLRMIYSKNGSGDLSAKCKIGVFVSNDRVNWTQLKSLRKHSYKWYRFRIQTSMTDLDALTAVTCLVDEKQSNKLR